MRLYLSTQRAVMLRVGVTVKQIENKHLQKRLIFRVRIIWGALSPNALLWLRAWTRLYPGNAIL